MNKYFLISFLIFLFACSDNRSNNIKETYSDNDIQVRIKSLIDYMEIDIQDVKIADGKIEGGVRNMIISIVANSDKSMHASELTKVLECGNLANEKFNADLDETTVIIGNSSGDAMAAITVKVTDIEIFQRTKEAELYVSKWTVLRYDKSYLSNLLSLAKNQQ
jgi:hypothetical protein